jgi:hypothetical protein
MSAFSSSLTQTYRILITRPRPRVADRCWVAGYLRIELQAGSAAIISCRYDLSKRPKKGVREVSQIN